MNKSDKQLRDHLTSLGLTEREAKAYLALLGSRGLTASEISLATRIPQNKIYTSLDSLVQQGFCQRQKHGRQRVYSAIDPNLALAGPLQELENQLQSGRQITQELAETFAQSRATVRNLTEVEILDSPQAIRERYQQLLSDTQQEIAGLARGPYAYRTQEDWDALLAEGRRLARKYQTRWVYEMQFPRDRRLAEALQSKGNLGEIRATSALPLKMIIFDRRTVLFTDENPDVPDQLNMAVIHNPTVAKAFLLLFESFWQNAVDLEVWSEEYL